MTSSTTGTTTSATDDSSTRPRVPAQVYLLAAAIFCLGTSEFMIAGLLEPISADLGISIPQAGLLITGFAVGMIVGAPAMALLTLRLPRRATMIITIVAFSALHILGALAPNYPILMLSRVLSAVACGGFWAVAAVHTTRIAPVQVRGRALASLVGGLTVANLVGVPMGAWIGAQFGWRATFWAIAIVTAAAAVLIAVMTRPSADRDSAAEAADRSAVHLPTLVRAELAAFRGPRIWLALSTTALFQASVFAAFSYFSPLLTQIAGIPHDFVPGVLAAFGIGAFIGVVVGGRLADRTVFGNIVGSLTALALSLFALWLVAGIGWAAIVVIVLIGASGFSIAGALNARVFQIATEAPTLAASVNTSAFNVGNALGPAAGAAVIALGWGFRAPVVVAIVLAVAALGVAAVAIRGERAWRQRQIAEVGAETAPNPTDGDPDRNTSSCGAAGKAE
ncbi:Cmx/CmrA family chloramphenicol efflux MFS transporter [Brevibacterium casei]|uniref:MFS transporter, DHA1 family, chloramphenicol resistance protein n=1 Tax=Brevibacterium casei CIP 102111 TaxID=1255625 RepID=A0A2H1J8R4_9MICO|nr:Cmx/CmrA family chloramphenicol efflux MFS transporter [Brevibacterium casei]MCT1552015.1 MFS transporter [Brevibacterium casei]MCT1561824.1 MFS transporter [Brevibacterium casei]MCT2209751.1 MFS transporter [Brevibacterium casei]QPR38868.1 MFS transporter [Brevibacterium casei]QPR43034.1 MFS transporter [Brevibacterium casei]